jgi:hypothetical protein
MIFSALTSDKLVSLFQKFHKAEYNNKIIMLQSKQIKEFEEVFAEYNGLITVDGKYFRLDKKEPYHSIGSFGKKDNVVSMDKMLKSFL